MLYAIVIQLKQPDTEKNPSGDLITFKGGHYKILLQSENPSELSPDLLFATSSPAAVLKIRKLTDNGISGNDRFEVCAKLDAMDFEKWFAAGCRMDGEPAPVEIEHEETGERYYGDSNIGESSYRAVIRHHMGRLDKPLFATQMSALAAMVSETFRKISGVIIVDFALNLINALIRMAGACFGPFKSDLGIINKTDIDKTSRIVSMLSSKIDELAATG